MLISMYVRVVYMLTYNVNIKMFFLALRTLHMHVQKFNGEECFTTRLSQADAAGAGGKFGCRVPGCGASVKESGMRAHIGAHFVLGHLRGVMAPCGYCGQAGCQPKLTKAARSPTLKESCSNFYGVGFRLPAAGKAGCMNHVLRCPTCQNPEWAYNLERHYAMFHRDEELSKVTKAYVMTSVELKFLEEKSSLCKCNQQGHA